MGTDTKSSASTASATSTPSKKSYLGHRQRIQTRILQNGAESLSEYEVLEALLFFSIPLRDTKETAKQLLGFDGKQTKRSLGEVLGGDADRLMESPYIGVRSVMLFRLVAEIAKRMGRETVTHTGVLDSWQDIIQFCRTTIGHSDRELFLAIFLNAKNHLIAHKTLAEGTIDRVAVYPREVVKYTLDHKAVSVILAHNHPSGETNPSPADIEMTKRIVEALRPIDVRLHDHIIISPSAHFSFKNEGLLV